MCLMGAEVAGAEEHGGCTGAEVEAEDAPAPKGNEVAVAGAEGGRSNMSQ